MAEVSRCSDMGVTDVLRGTVRPPGMLPTSRSPMSNFARDECSFFGDGENAAPPPQSLHAAAAAGNVSRAADLFRQLARGQTTQFNVDQAHDHLTPLLYAARAGQMEMVSLLLRHSADVNAHARVNASAWSVQATASWSAHHCAAQRSTDGSVLATTAARRAGRKESRKRKPKTNRQKTMAIKARDRKQ